MSTDPRQYRTPDAQTALYGILGHPVGHSLSPAMHNAAFLESGQNAVYLAFDVTDLPSAVRGIRALGVLGLSVTIPHKAAICPLLDELDPMARKLGAVNTVVNRNGYLVGANTDWIGALQALGEVINPSGRHVLVLGAGGSARAVCMGLADQGAKVHIANRTVEKAAALAALCGGTFSGLDQLDRLDATVLVNTTSVGMVPKQTESPIPSRLLPRFEVVMDLVYAPLTTRLLAEAEAAGCKTVNGLRMLLHQAVAQFELWTDTKAPVETMARALEHALEERGTS